MNSSFEAEDDAIELHAVESMLQSLEPRAPQIDMESLLLTEERAKPSQAPLHRSRHSPWMVAGIWLSGVAAGCLIMALARPAPLTTDRRPHKEQPTSSQSVAPSATNDVADSEHDKLAIATHFMGHNIAAIIEGQPLRLSSASHLSTAQSSAGTEQLAMANPPELPKQQDTTPREPLSRREMMNELLDGTTF